MFHAIVRPDFYPDPKGFSHEKEREEYVRRLKGEPEEEGGRKEKKAPSPKSLSQLIELVSPEDSALIALIVFLLCDNTNNDVVLLGILLYILLS